MSQKYSSTKLKIITTGNQLRCNIGFVTPSPSALQYILFELGLIMTTLTMEMLLGFVTPSPTALPKFLFRLGLVATTFAADKVNFDHGEISREL